ncbi:cysteine desulfurase family protein [Enorma phocaeensis]|uniref:Cysteine desulfurase n=1 Tax=Enorma phocaeensis TaxID=1871019 RepID=A0A921IT98_9ACTN|nr:cysteine desulfurase family protein [Enorma phocaeensis]HJG37407.1 cysteine desulfurase [Enorma phocaeensis]
MRLRANELVNLDYAASTPLRDEAIQAMASYDASPLAGANPNSLHSLGRLAAQELESSRRTIARTLGRTVRPHEVILTAGGTEANVRSLLGIAEGMRQRDHDRTRVIVSAIEHDSILDNIPEFHRRGFSVDVVAPDRQGRVVPSSLAELLREDVALVSIMLANNETGVVQPIDELSRLAHDAGACFHTDAIQGYLHIPFDVSSLGVDALSLAGHKVGAPVSCGAIYLKHGTPFMAISHGGGQEAGRRPGTQDVRSAVALAAVARSLAPHVALERKRLEALADALYLTLTANDRIHATMGDPYSVDRLPGIVSVFVDGWESEDLILKLDSLGFCVSAGSACSSGSAKASHVLTAMGIPQSQASGSLRISFDDRVDPQSLDRFAQELVGLVQGRA